MTVKFYLNHPYEKQTAEQKAAKAAKVLRKEEVPVDVMISLNRKERFPLTTGERIQPKYWDKKANAAKATFRGHIELNSHLARIKEDLIQVWRNNKGIRLEELKVIATKVVKGDTATSSQKKTVIEAVQQFIAQYAKEKDQASLSKYKALLKRLTDFANIYPLSFETLDFNFYDAFKNYLYNIPNPNYTGSTLLFDPATDSYIITPGDSGSPVGLFDEVVFKYFTNLKTVCAWAEKRGFEVHSSYKAWEVIKREYQPISLTLDELRKLEETPLTGSKEIARDYLSLECRTGQRISDLRRFNKNDVSGHTWTFTQKKGNRLTTKTISLPLVGYCAPALLILQKYNYELPKISEQNLNYNIKKACEASGIDTPMYIERWAGNKKIRIPGRKYEFLSTHTGRKTFITIALQFMKPQVVMSITGIRSYKTLKHYDGGSEIGTIEAGLKSIEDNISLMRRHG